MFHLAKTVQLIFAIYIILLIVRILFAWLRPNMFNPVVRLVYRLTDPYLKFFAKIRFLRIGSLDLSPLFAFYVLYLIMGLLNRIILHDNITLQDFFELAITYFFRFVYFFLIIFIITVALRFIFGFIKMRGNNVVVTAVYSISEHAVRPFRNLLKVQGQRSFDIAALFSLLVLVITRFFVLPWLLEFILNLINGSGL